MTLAERGKEEHQRGRPQSGLLLVIKVGEIQLYTHTEYLHVLYQIKRATEDLENLKITPLSWKNISKFTVASGFSQI